MTGTILLTTETQATPITKKVRTLMNKVMNYPDFAKKSNATGIVYVSFETRADGTIEVLGLNASSEKFGEYVTEKLSKVKFNKIDTNQVYNYKFTFKPEK